MLNTLKITGNCFVILPKPNPIQNSKRVNPIVAPETNGKAVLNPRLKPIDKEIKFTGPGEKDITNEKTLIARIVEIIGNPRKKLDDIHYRFD